MLVRKAWYDPLVEIGLHAKPPPMAYLFGDFFLQPTKQRLIKNGERVRIGGRAFDLLTALVERPGELLSKDDLIARAWPETFVVESNLKVNMAALRRALNDRFEAPTYIATDFGRGYRFVATVRSLELSDQAASLLSQMGPPLPAQPTWLS